MSLKILGMMTGTSCDGLDLSCMVFANQGVETLWGKTLPYPKVLRKRVLEAQKPGTRLTLLDWEVLNRDLAEWYAQSVQVALKGFTADQRPDVLANHGQTVGHFPSERVSSQYGCGAILATRTGLTVIDRFRDGDLAAGGEGAPLVPKFHRFLLKDLLEIGDPSGIAVHNLGGMSNISYFGPEDLILGWDTGPGNCLMDLAAERVTKGRLQFDRDGKLAIEGRVHSPSLKKLLAHPYFKKPQPKSTGRDDFSADWFFSKTKGVKGADLVATATVLTVQTVLDAYVKEIIKKGLPLHTIVLCGGGAKNPAISEMLQEALPEVEVTPISKLGVDEAFVEAQAIAYFGFLALQGRPLGGSWTGAKGFGVPASIEPGQNWKEVLAKLSELEVSSIS